MASASCRSKKGLSIRSRNSGRLAGGTQIDGGGAARPLPSPLRAPTPGRPRLRCGHPDCRRPERGVLVECAQAFLATEAALADAAEGELHAGADAPAVDVNLAGADLAREPEGAVDVLRPDGGGEVVADAVRDAQRLVLVAERDDGQYRPEDLVGGDRA